MTSKAPQPMPDKLGRWVIAQDERHKPRATNERPKAPSAPPAPKK